VPDLAADVAVSPDPEGRAAAATALRRQLRPEPAPREERWEGRGEERRGGRGLRKLWLRGKRGERFLKMLIFVDGQLSRLTVFIFVGGNLVSRDLPA
jgi:hypothetical protein